jgi:acyl carrier protein
MASPLPSTNSSAASPAAPDETALIAELHAQIVAALNLDPAVAPADGATPLYGEGLGLDSIDILEVALLLSKRYGLQLRADDGDNAETFRCLGSLAHYVAIHRTK